MLGVPSNESFSRDILHGIPVADPYRWLEDRTSSQTEEWLARQQVRHDSYFAKLRSVGWLEKRVRDHLNVDNVDSAGKVKEDYFFRLRRAGEEQARIFVRDGSTSRERVLVDPSTFGIFASVGIHCVSDDSRFLAYEMKLGGEDSHEIHVVDVRTGWRPAVRLERGYNRGFLFAINNVGFYYCHEVLPPLSPASRDHVVCFHRFGTTSRDDEVLFRRPRSVTSKLVIRAAPKGIAAIFCHEQAGTPVVDLYVCEFDDTRRWEAIFRNTPMPHIPFFHRGRLFAHRMTKALNREIVELDPTNGTPRRVIVPEQETSVGRFICAGDRIYASYPHGQNSNVKSWSIDGEFTGELPLAVDCSWRLLQPFARDPDHIFLQCESFTLPPSLHVYEPERNSIERWWGCHTSPMATLVCVRGKYQSPDGTPIPMCRIYSEESRSRTNSPAIMTAYGGFGVTMAPKYSVFISILLELGFFFAIPGIRGGGDFGRSWHDAARGRKRQVAIDDFITGAQWLCEQSLTSPERLAVFGGSNSGTLIGAAVTQRPDLFGAAICIAPLLDMLRYHHFDRARMWSNEYGNPEHEEDFRALLAYSPYHRVAEDVDYPAMYLVSGDKDNRCNPAHARKMAARLAERRAQTHPVLLDHSTERGHSPTMPLTVRVRAVARRIAFLCRELDIDIRKEERHGLDVN